MTGLTTRSGRRPAAIGAAGILAVLLSAAPANARLAERSQAQGPAPRLTLAQLVTPASRVESQGRLVRFALHGLVFFDTLTDLFQHIDGEAGRWRFESAAARQAFAEDLVRRGIESRVVSMETELPLELLLTHTRDELDAAVIAASGRADAVVFEGRHWRLTAAVYRDAFVRVRDRWSRSLNCWSASPSIPGRVLSNWYVIDEGIELYGAAYDSTEHFWQAVKYHPDVTVADLQRLLDAMRAVDWRPWLDSAGRRPGLLLRQRLRGGVPEAEPRRASGSTGSRPSWAASRRAGRSGARAPAADRPRARRRRRPSPRSHEKVLWGDLADVLHLVAIFAGRPGAAASPDVTTVREALVGQRFDAIYLSGYAGGRVGFLSAEFQALMLEIWKVKFLRIPRLGDVIRSTAGMRLDHFLNDGDSPDIPIPIYVGYLNRIREMAMETRP